MKLYKAESPQFREQYVQNMSYFSFSPDGALQWGKILFGATPFFIREYKVPNHFLALWNNGTYRFDPQSWTWTGGEGSTTLEPLSLIASRHLPITSQALVQTGDISRLEYRQIAYFNGKELVTKNKQDNLYISAANTLAEVSSYAEKQDVRLTQMAYFFQDSLQTGNVHTRNIDLEEIIQILASEQQQGNLLLKALDDLSMIDRDALTYLQQAFSSLLSIEEEIGKTTKAIWKSCEKNNLLLSEKDEKNISIFFDLKEEWETILTDTFADFMDIVHQQLRQYGVTIGYIKMR